MAAVCVKLTRCTVNKNWERVREINVLFPTLDHPGSKIFSPHQPGLLFSFHSHVIGVSGSCSNHFTIFSNPPSVLPELYPQSHTYVVQKFLYIFCIIWDYLPPLRGYHLIFMIIIINIHNCPSSAGIARQPKKHQVRVSHPHIFLLLANSSSLISQE